MEGDFVLKTPLSRVAGRAVVDADGDTAVGLSLNSKTAAIKEIVRRVNLHDELVEALRKARERMEDAGIGCQEVRLALDKLEDR